MSGQGDLRENPFSRLFSDVKDIDSFVSKLQDCTAVLLEHSDSDNFSTDRNESIQKNENETLGNGDTTVEVMDLDKNVNSINCLAEEIFLFTLSQSPVSFRNGSLTHLLYLKELAASLQPTETIDLENLEQVLFERLLIEDPTSCIITHDTSKFISSSEYVAEKECLTYLFNCYTNVVKKRELCTDKDMKNAFKTMMDLIVRNFATALKQPDLYEEKQELNKQIVNMFVCEVISINEITELFSRVAEEIERDEPTGTLLRAFTPTFDLVHKDLAQANILTLPKHIFLLLRVFASVPNIASVLLTHSTPNESKLGVAFANTLLGSAFSLSCLPKTLDGLYEFFDKPRYSMEFSSVEKNLWTSIAYLNEELHSVFLSLLKSTRRQTLDWIGACLDRNIHRGRLSAVVAYSPAIFTCVSDAFALNLSAVLLRLARPFISDMENPKLLRIDPTYTAFTCNNNDECHKHGVHMKSFSSETCLLPVEDNGSRPCAKNFSFITECFHMVHRSMDLGFRVVLENMQIIYKEFVRLQTSMREASAQGRSDVTGAIVEQMEMTTSRYFSMRCALLEPTTLGLIGDLLATTSVWLVQVVLDNDENMSRECFAPMKKFELRFPLPDHIPATLKCVPELFLENTASYLILLKRFSPSTLESSSSEVVDCSIGGLPPILTKLLVFMNSNKRARNPHLRARLAECLECLLPLDNDSNTLGTFYREALFKQHPFRKEIVRCLLDVFVGIEMTGESVSFEQKFNYRRPMYTVMTYLWDIPEHRDQFKQLAVEAEQSMEAVTPPLFLRFLNLLMNDAIFLLDEALSNMAQLRTMQTARENGEWENLPGAERERNAVHFQQIGITARINNILGQETIHALEYLSSEIKSIFCHPTMSDRVAAMLNYFLVHLVGPNMKNFKVKDQKEYKFEPATFVINICKIYIHLSESDEFCAAVSRDGRSYKPQLFQQAHDVLVRIGGSSLIGDLLKASERVQNFADLQKVEDEVLMDAPEEFLDPIMQTIMVDPVKLPSSRIIVDRSTIARHLLSDQSDPFNRSLLTMDMVTSETELKGRIEKWLDEKRKQRKLAQPESGQQNEGDNGRNSEPGEMDVVCDNA